MQLKKKYQSADKKYADAVTATILCFVGPPGVGKTSIGRSIAKALKRQFIKVSLGGIRDEAEIRGHRRTYVGALPGRIIQGIKTAKTNNPVFMLDEIDKVGADFRGDPSAALLEALDPEQNKDFSDHYLEVPFDLSQVMFITTANILDTIPPALRDRLEVIHFSGYTAAEKENIAVKYLINKTLAANGLPKSLVSFPVAVIKKIIDRYTREAGVRNLEREISKVMRKIAKKIAIGKHGPFKLTLKNLGGYLGPEKFTPVLKEKKDDVGVATGLAWTEAGGDVLFIEVAAIPGKGKITLTGQLGEVMKESAQAAFSYVRSRWQTLGLKKDFYQSLDVHVHVPEGAVPKDGPSAGITIATAIISALTKKKVKKTVAMTGEITLRGRVLEIGGVKEKVIAAHRAGITTLILPLADKKYLEKIPANVQKDIHFHFVSHLDEVLPLAFV
jgi:ATP-dependent Lon protease